MIPGQCLAHDEWSVAIRHFDFLESNRRDCAFLWLHPVRLSSSRASQAPGAPSGTVAQLMARGERARPLMYREENWPQQGTQTAGDMGGWDLNPGILAA